MDNKQHRIEHDYLSMAEQFLRLSHLTANKLVQGGNCSKLVLCDTDAEVEASIERQDWADHSIAMPILFNFFHGIELTLKGLIYEKQADRIKAHGLSDFMNLFLQEYPEEVEIRDLLDKYIRHIPKKSALHRYLNKNRVSIDQWYLFLKYPEDNNKKPYDITMFYDEGSDSLKFWENISQDSHNINRLATEVWMRNKGHDASAGGIVDTNDRRASIPAPNAGRERTSLDNSTE
ncbi:hypothetical protein E5C31_11165 [Providencia rettgeri]|nr:hypothetical protein [Providencia rettgeri]